MSRFIATRRGLILTALCAATFIAVGNAHADGDEPMLNVSGELSYRQRIALPPNAVAFVEIRESNADSETPAVAQTRIELDGRQVPVSFSLELPRAHLEDGASYLLSGGILVDDQVNWRIVEPVSIDTSASHFDAGILMLSQQEIEEPQPTEATGQEAMIGEWRILELGKDTLDTETNATLVFTADGTFSGRLCNSFSGSYTVNDATISFGQAAATLMACPEPQASQERTLFTAFESASAYRIGEDGMLALLDDKGQILLSAQR